MYASPDEAQAFLDSIGYERHNPRHRTKGDPRFEPHRDAIKAATMMLKRAEIAERRR